MASVLSSNKQTIHIVGAGLSGGLLAWLCSRRNEIDATVFEAAPQISRRKTWSFHRSDVGSLYSDIQPLISHEWSGYDTYFPEYSRRIESPYCSIRPAHFEKTLVEHGVAIEFGMPIAHLNQNVITLSNGKTISSDCVIDARGIAQAPASQRNGFQKFLGQEIELKTPHGLERPVLMDATVEQRDGFRFFYLLPWTATSLLIEDTRYSSNDRLDIEEFRSEIAAYCDRKGWTERNVISEEHGALPIPIDEWMGEDVGAPSVGMSSGLFHPVTGYSLPDAVKVAHAVSILQRIEPIAVKSVLSNYRNNKRSVNGFYRMLNRMMFLAASPNARRKIFERFYRLSEPLIERFYSGSSTVSDRIRILSGRPPVPVFSALRAIVSKSRELR